MFKSNDLTLKRRIKITTVNNYILKEIRDGNDVRYSKLYNTKTKESRHRGLKET